jgi:hypothetical protein
MVPRFSKKSMRTGGKILGAFGTVLSIINLIESVKNRNKLCEISKTAHNETRNQIGQISDGVLKVRSEILTV